MNVTRQWYENYEARRKASRPKLERRTSHEPLEAPQAQEIDSGKCEPKFAVLVTSYRRRLTDEDNLAEKFHVDALRYAGLLPSDAPGITHIQVQQFKVKSKADERTELLIIEK